MSKINETLRGNIGKDVEVGEIQTKENGMKPVANFSIAIKDGAETKWINCEAWDKNIDKVKNLKKGDFIELNGVYKAEYTTGKGETKKDFNVFEATQLNQTIKGNIGSEPTIKEINTKNVANFSVAVKEGENTKWVNCQAWEKNVDSVKDLKKGDFVELKGTLGKEYGEDKKRDLVVSETKILKLNESKAVELSDTDKTLIESVKAGDHKSVGNALKAGGNPSVITKEHYKALDEKKGKVIADTIEHFKINGTLDESKKKNNGIKM